MDICAIRHPPFCLLGHPTNEGFLKLLEQAERELRNGKGSVITTGVPRTDAVGPHLSQQTGKPHAIITEFGPIHAFFSALVSNTTFHSLISNPRLVQRGLELWASGLLPLTEQPKPFLERVERGVDLIRSQYPASLLVTHRETIMALLVISGKVRNLREAAKLEVPYLHTTVFSF